MPKLTAIMLTVSCLLSVLSTTTPLASATDSRYGVVTPTNAYFLDIIDGDPLDTGVWNSTWPPYYTSWQNLVYPGENTASSDSIHLSGTPGIGWYEIKLQMDNDNATYPVPDGWYKLYLCAMMDGGSGGNTTTVVLTMAMNGVVAETYYCTQWGTWQALGYPKGRGGQCYYGALNESPTTGLPWRPSQILRGWELTLSIHIVSGTWASNHFGAIWAALIPTTGPAIAELGYQILRPNDDVFTSGWSALGDTPFNDCVNDTGDGGDDDSTYVTSEDAGSYLLGFGFDDPDSTLFNTSHSFSLVLWIYAKSNSYYTADRALRLVLVPGLEPFGIMSVIREDIVSGDYDNYSFAMPRDYPSMPDWSFSSVVDIQLIIAGGTNLSITQIALIVHDEQYEPPTPVTPESGRWAIGILTPQGLMSLICILGFAGMIATPTISYLAYRDGEEGLLAGANGIWLMAFFFGLFVAGLWAGGG